MMPLFSDQPEISKLAYYAQDGRKNGSTRIEVLENKLTYFDGLSYHIPS